MCGLKRNGNLQSICLKQHNYREADPGIVLKRKNIFENTNVNMNLGWVVLFSVNMVTQNLMQNILDAHVNLIFRISTT